MHARAPFQDGVRVRLRREVLVALLVEQARARRVLCKGRDTRMGGVRVQEVWHVAKGSAPISLRHAEHARPRPQPAPFSICTSSASTYCTVSGFVTFLSTVMNASMYAGPDCTRERQDRFPVCELGNTAGQPAGGAGRVLATQLSRLPDQGAGNPPTQTPNPHGTQPSASLLGAHLVQHAALQLLTALVIAPDQLQVLVADQPRCGVRLPRHCARGVRACVGGGRVHGKRARTSWVWPGPCSRHAVTPHPTA